MNSELKALAELAGLDTSLMEMGCASLVTTPGVQGVAVTELEAFAKLIAADCAKIVAAQQDTSDDDNSPGWYAAQEIKAKYKVEG